MSSSLSIIVPCLNEASCIAKNLDALAPLRAGGAEVIVVDGGSTDATAAVARPFADTVITSARGRALQMNAGAAIARKDVLLFLHADTRLPSSADTFIMAGLTGSKRAWGRFDVQIAGTHSLLPVIATLMNVRSRVTRIATGDQGIFVHRDLFERVGGYRPIALMEDVELSVRLKRYGPPLCLNQRVVTSGRRWEENGVIRTILLMWRLRFAYSLGADPDELAHVYGARK